MRLLLLFLAFALPALAQEDQLTEEPVARVGSRAISCGEFLQRYEFGPGLERQTKGKTGENKQVVLVSLIAEKLLAEEARVQGLAAIPEFRTAVKDAERLLVRDELYRREVREKVTLSEQEVQQALALSGRRLKVRLVFSPTEEEARFLQRQISSGTPLEALVLDGDSTGTIARTDTLTVRWGEGNPTVEGLCYALRPGETSQAARFDDGFYFFKVVSEAWISGSGVRERKSERERVERELRRRREEERTFQYMTTVLRGKAAQVRRPVFKQVVDGIVEIARSEPGRPQAVAFDEKMLAILSTRLKTIWNDPFVDFPHAQWSVGETLQRLRESGFALSAPVERTCRKSLDDRLRSLVFQEELTEEGYRNHLDRAARVTGQLRMWDDSYLASLLRNRIADSVLVRTADVVAYRKQMGGDSTVAAGADSIRTIVRRLKARALIDRRLAALADREGVSIDQSLLASTNVTSLPAVFYHLIGFGGRMLAVPLLPLEIDWLKYCRTRPVQLP